MFQESVHIIPNQISSVTELHLFLRWTDQQKWPSLPLLSSTFSYLPVANILYKPILVKGNLLSPVLDYLYFLSSKWIVKSAQCLMQFKTFRRWHNIISSPSGLQILYSIEVEAFRVFSLKLPLLFFQSLYLFNLKVLIFLQALHSTGILYLENCTFIFRNNIGQFNPLTCWTDFKNCNRQGVFSFRAEKSWLAIIMLPLFSVIYISIS